MGIDTLHSPSALIGKTFAVNFETVPRAASEVEAERSACKNRTQYMRRVEEVQGLSWHERRKLEIERMKKRRTGENAASGSLNYIRPVVVAASPADSRSVRTAGAG